MFTNGQLVNGYEVVGPVSGGKSQSWQATRDRELYFLKLLPRPKYPRPDKPTPDRYQQMLTVCDEFERRHVELMQKLSDTIVGGGNLVKPTGFFREGNCYLKAYQFVSGESSRSIATSSVTREGRVIFLRTLLLCLRELHTQAIVHGDLKPENVLIERRGAFPVARLIDFDEAYVSGQPPPANQAPGSEDYYSPELVRYRNNDGAPADLTISADIFALGLVIHVAMVGRRPATKGGAGETPAEVVASGGTLHYDSLDLGMPEFEATVHATSAPRPSDRPTIEQLLTSIGVEIAPLPPPAAPSDTEPLQSATEPPPSRVISTVGRRKQQQEGQSDGPREGTP